MQKIVSSIASLGTALALGAAAASADTIRIGVTGDANIRNGTSSGVNSNGSQLVLVGDAGASTYDFLRGVFSFNLNASELAGATINSVSLNLFAAGADGTSNSGVVTINVFQLNRAFNETQVTWNVASTGTNWTPPGGDFSSTLLSSVSASPVGITANQQFSFGSSASFVSSVTGTLQQTDKTLGLLLKLDIEDTTRSIFRFNAGSTTNVNIAASQFRPELVIDYTPAAVPEPSAFAALTGAGMLGFAVVRRRARR